MLKTLLSPVTGYVLAALAVGVLVFSAYINSKDAKISKLEAQHQIDTTVIQNNEVLTGINKKLNTLTEEVRKSDKQVNTILTEKVRIIKDAPNADSPVPPDVAAAWHSAIVGLRNED